MKIIGKIKDVIVLLLTGKGRCAEKAIEDDLLDYSGQGRDKYGR